MLSPYAPLATRFVGNLPAVPADYNLVDADEAQLIAASQRGDAEAYGFLVRKYQVRLCSSLRHVCGTVTDAQDAAQEAFLKAFLNLKKYNGASAFYTWLYRIAVNSAISEQRKCRTRNFGAHSLAMRESVHRADTAKPDDPLLRAERVAEIRQALDNLSSEHRTILVLREIENCDYDEIASLLNIPVGTVRSRLHRARLELRRELDFADA
jgi:RNA polymerase sigma-70 factor (ECF subfamily)